jgi:Holliday junction DNA helicase RuvB
MIREALKAAQIQNRPVPHTLLFGPPGTGKSSLSKILAAEAGGGFIETTASTLHTLMDVIRILSELNRLREETGKSPVLFIDEIHRLGDAKGRQSIDQEALFSLLEDYRFEHNERGKTFQARDGRTYALITDQYLVWPFTCVGATTEPGLLSSPLLRRFLLHVSLDRYSEEEIAQIIVGSAERLKWPLDVSAAAELAKYSRLNPGRSFQLLTSGRNRAIATGRDTITLEVAEEVIARMRLFPLGLDETDIRILRLLADRVPRGVGATEICRAVGISNSQFSGLQEPFLRLLGLVETLSRRVITPSGLVYLAQFGQVDTSRPEVRAALQA